MKIDWSQHSAEEIIEAIKEHKLVVMTAWGERDKFTGLRSRFSAVFPEGCHKHACVGRVFNSDIPYEQSPFYYSLDSPSPKPGGYKSGFATEEEAMKAADEEMRRRGWKLVGDPPPVTCGCGAAFCPTCQDFKK